MRRDVLLILVLAALPAAADELSVRAIVSSIRFHPEGRPARVGLTVLSRLDVPGWKALASLAAELRVAHPDVARAAAEALAEGPEKERLVLAASAYRRIDDPALRAILAVGIAYGYDEHSALLSKHMRENRQGATDVLRILAPTILPEPELRDYLANTAFAPIAYAALRGRGLTVQPRELLPWARETARKSLDPATCDAWARKPDFVFHRAVALTLGEEDADVREGAHCLLMTLSGRKLLADPDVWRSWIASHAERYEAPPPLSQGRIAAAVVRGARHLRRDLLDDGRALWANDPNHAVGATALAVMGLRAAGYPADHPAIRKALTTTLLVFGPGGAPALRPLRSRHRESYELALLAIALCEVDARRFRPQLEILHRRLVTGMQRHGQWGYQCLEPTDSMRPTHPDNSITQYAVLALRALQRKGVQTKRETWKTIADYLYKSVNRHGGWSYWTTGRYSTGRQISMTSAGISSLAIALEALGAGSRIGMDPVLERARVYLGRMLMLSNYGNEELYAYYGVERALVLTATKGFKSRNRSFDWYLRGARRLLDSQHASGFWHRGYGRAIDTAYGLLFLTKATTTIGRSEPAWLKVELPPEQDKPEPSPPPPEPPPPPPPPTLDVPASVPTRNGAAVIHGRTNGTSLSFDGRPARVDARGRFAIPVTITSRRSFRLVARDDDGRETERDVVIAFDTKLPRVRLLGPAQRHVGKQVLIFRADEPLRSLQVAGRVYPADGPTVRAAVEVREARRDLTVIATDRAGNQSRNPVVIEAVNRVLVLDGRSALGIDLRENPGRLTLECWVRGGPPGPPTGLLANTEHSGCGLLWAAKGHVHPYAMLRAGGKYIGVDPKRPWSWGTWTHLALCYDGLTLRYFVNGQLQGENTGQPYARSSRRFYLGAEPDRHNNPVSFFTGEVDEVRISRVARYDGDFRPQRSFMRDRHTLLLLHFDRLAEGAFLDDSGNHVRPTVHGAPAQAPGAAGSVLAHARAELARLLPPLQPLALTPEQHAGQNARALESAASLRLLDVTVRVVSAQGVPVSGVAVSGLQETLDVSHGPSVTDERGEARLRLPRGPWRLHLVTHEPQAGRIVFARVRRDVREAGREEIALDQRRQVRFRSRLGEARAAHVVTLAWPDFTFHKQVEAVQGQFDVRTTGDEPMVVQAVRHPTEVSGGYILRRTVGVGTTIVETDPEEHTLHTFRGKGLRELSVRYGSADALPVPLAFTSKDTRRVLIAGLGEVVLGLDVDWGGRRYGFYPRPIALDGQPREFLAAPPFKVDVGFIHNWRPRLADRQHSLHIRVFVTTPNGLVLRHDPRGAYTVAWEQVLDGAVRASGVVRPPHGVYTPPLDPKQIPSLRYRLQIRGPGENRRHETAGHAQTAHVRVGKVATVAFPEVAGNARMWAACVDRGIRAYEETCRVRRRVTNIERTILMPRRVAGMGGFGGADGWMWLPEHPIYGFVGQWYWTGLLAHELGHVHGYGHGNPTQTRIMRQAGRRAGRRLWAIRPGMARVPEGNRYLPLLQAITRGEVSVEQEFEDARDIPVLRKTGEGHSAGDGVLVPNLEITGDDAVFMWFYRAMYGEKVDAYRRQNAYAWSWWLTLKGYTDPEIQIAMFSRAAGASLAWLARLRGNMTHDHRIDAALKELEDNKDRLVQHRERAAVLARWRHRRFALSDDLAALEDLARREIGHRWERFRALKRIAHEHFARREVAAGETMLEKALIEARLGGEGMLESALNECAPLWAAR